MTIHGDIINNTKGVTIAAGTASPSEGFFCGVRVGQLLVFCVVFHRSLFVV